MASKTLPPPGQLSLFDTGQYERVPQHYDIEDGYFEDDTWPPKLVSESTEEFVSESNWPPDPQNDSLTNDSLTNDSLTNDSLTTPQPCGAINRYHAGGTARGGGEYWRFSYRVGSRVRHVHITGGCCTSAIASARAAQVREAIASGSSTAEILELIRSWTRKSKIK